MKNNHIPRNIRLRNRVSKLEDKRDSSWKKIGGGNPYDECIYCHRSQPEVSYAGHYSFCQLKGIDNEIDYYLSLIEEDKPITGIKNENKY